MAQGPPGDPVIEARFLDIFMADLGAGVQRSLKAYQGLFPGHEDLVEREFERLHAERGGMSSSPDDAGSGESSASPSRDIGPYRIARELGRGGQGVVYLAEDRRLHRQVALKLLSPPSWSSTDGIQRFQREAEVASRLDHPGISTVYDVGAWQGRPFIAMQFIEGESLARKIAAGRGDLGGDDTSSCLRLHEMTEIDATSETSTGRGERAAIARVVTLIERTGRALHAAHESRIVHRDIKPGNIMVTPEGQPVILDFGLARSADGGQTITHSSDVFGTPAYLAPEQILESPHRLDGRTDVYGLGITLYECLTLRRPFFAPTRESLFLAILSQEAQDARCLNPSISRDLAVVLATALEKDRNRRYQTAEDFAEDLRRVRDHEPIRARPVGRLVRLARWAQRSPGTAAMAATAFLILAAGLVATLILKTEADENAARAETNARAATIQAARAEAALAEWTRLADGRRLEDLLQEAKEELWPAVPAMAGRMEQWLQRARRLAARLPEHAQALATVRERARSYTAEQRASDRASHSGEHQRIAELEGDLQEAAKTLAWLEKTAWPESRKERRREQIEERVATWTEELASLRTLVKRRRTWAFATAEDQLRHDKLRDLVEGLQDLVGPPRAGAATLANLEERLAFALSLEERTLRSRARDWDAAIAAIAVSPHYRGLRIAPQLGLVPLGADPESGLWEFAETMTGEIPQREPDGRLAIDDHSAIVFALLPGGSFVMGAQIIDPEGPNYDPLAQDIETPIHDVTLGPFFMSKYEMTQGQWSRFTGENPSHYGPDDMVGKESYRLRNPVEQVSWYEAEEVLRRLGLELPTEAQWEYAARAGTSTPWWCGPDRSSVATAANLADQYSRAHGGMTTWTFEDWNDGYSGHAPVGSFRANGFGLYDVLGNVWEYCRDGFGLYGRPVEPDTGLRAAPHLRFRVTRGGAFDSRAEIARCSRRDWDLPSWRNPALGFRPARRLVR